MEGEKHFCCSTRMKLKEYIENQLQESYYSGLLERYHLAIEFMRSFNDEYSLNKGISAVVPFFDLDNIELEERSQEQNNSVKNYEVILPDNSSFPKDYDTFTNYAFVHPQALPSNADSENNGEVSDFYEFNSESEKYIIHTLAVILFHIYFGCHPLRGREYYVCSDVSPEHERDFFKEKHDFIFKPDASEDAFTDTKFFLKLQDNPNRFVNGYHYALWGLWTYMSPAQMKFWIDTFSGDKITDYENFYKEWKEAYASFTEACVLTPCNEKLNTIAFNEKYALITSDLSIGNRFIKCKNCNKALINKCSNCQLASESKVARFLTKKVKLCKLKRLEDGSTSEEKTEIELYDSQIICDSSGKEVFRVIASQKNIGIFGLMNLLDTEIKAVQNEQSRSYGKNKIIALLDGVHVFTKDVLSDIYAIIVPSVPKTSTPSNAKPNSNQQDKNPTVTVAEKPNTSMSESADKSTDESTDNGIAVIPPNPLKNPSTATEQTDVTGPSNAEQAPVIVSEQSDADESSLIYTEDSNIIFEVINKVDGVSDDCQLYNVKKRESQKEYSMILFNEPTNETERSSQEETIRRIRDILSKISSENITLPQAMLYPKHIVCQKGFASNRFGYIREKLPDTAKHIFEIFEADDTRIFDKNEILALFDMFKTIRSFKNVKTIFDDNILYDHRNISKMYLDLENGKCYFINDFEKPNTGINDLCIDYYFATPEFFKGKKIDEAAAAYSYAVVAFMVLFKIHPYGNTLWRNRPEKNEQRESVKNYKVFDQYLNVRKYYCPSWNSRAWFTPTANIPDFILKMFNQTFNPSKWYSPLTQKNVNEIAKWCDAFSTWYNRFAQNKF